METDNTNIKTFNSFICKNLDFIKIDFPGNRTQPTHYRLFP